MIKITKAFLLSIATFTIGFATVPLPSAHAQDDEDYGYDQSYDESGEAQEEAPTGPSLNVSVQMNMSGEYSKMFNKEKEKYQIFLRALNNSKDSNKGSKPVRLDIDGGDAAFQGIEDEPKGVLVALSKQGTNYQYFCSGKNVKNGVISKFPQSISITLKNGNKPYKTAAGTLRNDSYPNCEVTF